MSTEISELEKKIQAEPYSMRWVELAAQYWLAKGQVGKSAELYLDYIKRCPEDADGCFNCAYYLKHAEQFELALDYYQRAIDKDIAGQEEVYLNMAIVHSDGLYKQNEAKQLLEKALQLKPQYIPALYNLANIYEDLGDKENALLYFSKIEDIDPSYVDASARILQLRKNSENDRKAIESLQHRLSRTKLTPDQIINSLYALGKAYDDMKDYSLAFRFFSLANEHDSKTLPQYDATAVSEFFKAVSDEFSEKTLGQITPNSNSAEKEGRTNIFICGMYRSGSTLIEQILASHSAVTAAGEQTYFPKVIAQGFGNFPFDRKHDLNYSAIASDYHRRLSEQGFSSGVITDKRNNNLSNVGFIKQCLPNAKFIFTNRDIRDNCLSVYFLRLGASMNYATNLANIKHYYQEQQALQQHWKSLFPEDVYLIDYEALVVEPEVEIKKLLNFLELEWQDDCLDFYKIKNSVKTASAWQVRQPLYQSSAGRWKNYESELSEYFSG